MKTMQITSDWTPRGVSTHCMMLIRELVARGHDVTLVHRPGAWIAKKMQSDPVEMIESDLHRWPTDELRRITTIAKDRGVDVIHTHMSRAHFFGVLLRWFSAIPCVATAHSRHFQLHWMFNDLVIAVSEATRRYHRRYNFVRGNRIVTIHNFIDYRQLPVVTPDARRRVRASLGVDESYRLIGAIGAICRKKGQLYLVRALPRVLTAEPNARLLIVGGVRDHRYLRRVKATARQLNVGSKIIWAGHRDDVHEILAALDLCALASLEESLPMVVVEAMAAGLLVVATAVGGLPECVLANETGILVPPADDCALAEAIIPLLADPDRCRQLGQAGRRRVKQCFSTDSQVTLIEAAYDRVISRRCATADPRPSEIRVDSD
jgi:glycosyltransferase involved in cell wall biosynthesis